MQFSPFVELPVVACPYNILKMRIGSIPTQIACLLWLFVVPHTGVRAAEAQAQTVTVPRTLYVVTEMFSDFGPSLYYRILELSPEGDDTAVRFVRFARLDMVCPGRIIQMTSTRLKGTSPADLVGENNPCAVQSKVVDRAIARHAQHGGHFETAGYGIVAECGGRQSVLHLPYPEFVNMKSLERESPSIARLWHLAGELAVRIFGEKSPFHDITEARDLELQSAAGAIIPELRAGRFDAGFRQLRQTPGDLLKGYRGPLAPPKHTARLVTQLPYRFLRYEDPYNPPLAMQARIQGQVELELVVNPQTGEIGEVTALSGHPLLRQNAVMAAKRWQLDPASGPLPASLRVSFDFSFRCP